MMDSQNLSNWPKNGAILLVGNSTKNVRTEEKGDLERLAFLQARTLLTESSSSGDLLLEANNHPDFRYVCPIQPSPAIKIDQIRELIEWVSGKPQIAARQVAIVSPAHAMNLQAANALLKTLEEPSPHTLLMLITDKPSFIPAPVRSRCHWIRVRTQTKLDSACPLKAALLKDLAALKAHKIDPVSLGAQWVKADLKEVLERLLIILYEEMAAAADKDYRRLRNKRWWRFFDALLSAKRSLEAPNQPNTQLLIESLLIEYNEMLVLQHPLLKLERAGRSGG